MAAPHAGRRHRRKGGQKQQARLTGALHNCRWFATVPQTQQHAQPHIRSAAAHSPSSSSARTAQSSSCCRMCRCLAPLAYSPAVWPSRSCACHGAPASAASAARMRGGWNSAASTTLADSSFPAVAAQPKAMAVVHPLFASKAAWAQQRQHSAIHARRPSQQRTEQRLNRLRAAALCCKHQRRDALLCLAGRLSTLSQQLCHQRTVASGRRLHQPLLR